MQDKESEFFKKNIDDSTKQESINEAEPKENEDAKLSEEMQKIYDDYTDKKINSENFLNYKIDLAKITTINLAEDRVYDKVQHFIYSHETSINIKKIENNTSAIKNEILTMMTLFFAMFTFIQVNVAFVPGFLEKYNGYKLILSIAIINVILLVVLGFILEVVGAIVYGENKVRIWDNNYFLNILKVDKSSEKYKTLKKIFIHSRNDPTHYIQLFQCSELKIKRTFVLALILLTLIGGFAFKEDLKSKDPELYKEVDNKINQQLDKKIEEKLKEQNYKLTDEEKNNLKNEIENDLYKSNFQNNSKGK